MPDEAPTVDLPFGETQTTVQVLERYVDRKTARDVLIANGVSNAEERLSSFIEGVPELLFWLETNGRRFPWRETTDPWRVYLSEILLQRTRADAVEGIYEQFFDRFPDPKSLEGTTDSEIQDVIETLGFGNQRTRTLNEVATLIQTEHNGEVPRALRELQQPWRVGPYTARATMLFAFGEPLAIVDTNFARVIERVFGYEMPNQPHKSDEVYKLLDALVPGTAGLCRSVNLALLDLAAAICTPADPDCTVCPLADACLYAATADED